LGRAAPPPPPAGGRDGVPPVMSARVRANELGTGLKITPLTEPAPRPSDRETCPAAGAGADASRGGWESAPLPASECKRERSRVGCRIRWRSVGLSRTASLPPLRPSGWRGEGGGPRREPPAGPSLPADLPRGTAHHPSCNTDQGVCCVRERGTVQCERLCEIQNMVPSPPPPPPSRWRGGGVGSTRGVKASANPLLRGDQNDGCPWCPGPAGVPACKHHQTNAVSVRTGI